MLQGSTREQIVDLLKRGGEQTAGQLAAEIGITSMGVRQHLQALERDGLVETVVLRRRRGRPSHLFRLTERAEELFPARYAQLAMDLLEQFTETAGTKAVDGLFAGRKDTHLGQYKTRLAGKELRNRVRELARIRDEEGYMAVTQESDDGDLELVEHHCPIFAIAKRYPQACHYEQELFSQALGTDVDRTMHKVTGDGHCRYLIGKQESK